jgi:hypothetical protein
VTAQNAHARADVAKDHERCCLCFPALGNVRAHASSQMAELMERRICEPRRSIAARNSYFEPVRTLTHSLI